MKYIIFLSFILFLYQEAAAQTATDSASVTLGGKEKPRFPGGERELRKFLALNLRYPSQALENGIAGEVIISFRIDESGQISEVKSLKGLGYGCDEEAVRVVKKMPDWEPAHKNGQHLSVIYNLPIIFELPGTSQ